MLVWYQCLTSGPAPVHINEWHKCPCIAVNGIMWLRAWAQSMVINVCFFLRGIHDPLETTLMESALNSSIDCANCNSRLKPTAELHALVSKTPINESWENAWTPALGDSLSQTAMGWRKGSSWEKGGEGSIGLILLLFSTLHSAVCK